MSIPCFGADVYKRLFHREISSGSREFFRRVGFVGVSMAAVWALGYVLNALLARSLGPVSYGIFSLIQSFAMFACIPMAQGFHVALVKYNAEQPDPTRQRPIVSASYRLMLRWSLAVAGILCIAAPWLAGALGLARRQIYLIAIFSFSYVLFIQVMETLKSLHKLKRYAAFYAASAVVSLTVWLTAAKVTQPGVATAVMSICTGYVLVAALNLFSLRKLFTVAIDPEWVARIRSYSTFALMGSLAFTVVTNADKILINTFLDARSVGLYRAYYFCSVSLALGFSLVIFNTVFFPFASRYPDKSSLFRLLCQSVPAAAVSGIVGIVISETIAFFAYGSKYPADIPLLAMLAFAGATVFLTSGFESLIASTGTEGVKITASTELIGATLNVTFNLICIPVWGMRGAALALLLSYSVCFALIFLRGRKFFFKNIKG